MNVELRPQHPLLFGVSHELALELQWRGYSATVVHPKPRSGSADLPLVLRIVLNQLSGELTESCVQLIRGFLRDWFTAQPAVVKDALREGSVVCRDESRDIIADVNWAWGR